MRGLKVPLLITLIVSLAIGIGLGLKLRRDRATELGVVTSARKLKILALTGSLPASVLKSFRTDENTQVELIEAPTPDDVMQRLNALGDVDLVTLMVAQIPKAIRNKKVQTLSLSEIPGSNLIASDFVDLPAHAVAALPILWGVLGYAVEKSEADFKAWSDLTEAEAGSVELKPYLIEERRLEKLKVPAKALRAPSFFSSKSESNEVFAREINFAEMSDARFAGQRFVLPRDGGLFWILSLALGAQSANREEAKAFMTYILKPDVAAQIALVSRQASTHLGVEAVASLDAKQKPSALRKIPLNQLAFVFDEP